MPYPSWGDLGWLGMYPLLGAGLVLLLRARLVRVRTSLWLDGLTSGFGAAALLGAIVLSPVLELSGGGLAVVLTNLAYPVADLALLTVLMLVFNLHGWRPEPFWWLLGWVVVGLLVSDSVYLLQVAAGTYADATFLDAGWGLALAGLGVAAWMRPPLPSHVREGSASVAVPATLSLVSTGVLFAGALRALPFVVCLCGLFAVMIASLRLSFALVESRRLVAAQLEARTDELTGLPTARLRPGAGVPAPPARPGCRGHTGAAGPQPHRHPHSTLIASRYSPAWSMTQNWLPSGSRRTTKSASAG